jgi:hypothetical protein
MDSSSGAERGSRFAQGNPGIRRARVDQQDFRRRSGGTSAQEAGVAHARRVEDEEVSCRDQSSKVGKAGVLQPRCSSPIGFRASDHQESTPPAVG